MTITGEIEWWILVVDDLDDLLRTAMNCLLERDAKGFDTVVARVEEHEASLAAQRTDAQRALRFLHVAGEALRRAQADPSADPARPLPPAPRRSQNQLSDTRQGILRTMATRPKAQWSAVNIQDTWVAGGAPTLSAIQNKLGHMHADGQLDRPEHGKYRLPKGGIGTPDKA